MSVKAAVLGATLRLLRSVPPEFAWAVGERLGWLVGRLPLRDVRRAREHLAQAFPEQDAAWAARTARRCFRHFGGAMCWSLAAWTRDPVALRRGIAVEGPEHVRALVRACRRGEGTVVYAGHFGNWELLARVFGGLAPVAVIGRRLRDPAIDALVQGMRAGGGATVVYQDDDIRDLLRLLRSGRAIATLADQDVPQLAGTFVPWFGRLAYTPVAPAALALLGRAAVQSVHLYRRRGRWVLHAGPRRKVVRSGDREADQLAITAWATAYEEALVRREPAQWVWWHKRWRTRPPAESPAGAEPARI